MDYLLRGENNQLFGGEGKQMQFLRLRRRHCNPLQQSLAFFFRLVKIFAFYSSNTDRNTIEKKYLSIKLSTTTYRWHILFCEFICFEKFILVSFPFWFYFTTCYCQCMYSRETFQLHLHLYLYILNCICIFMKIFLHFQKKLLCTKKHSMRSLLAI